VAAVIRRVFLRLLGFIYLIAFASLALQIRGLVGEHGILPAARFLEWAHSIYGGGTYRLLPTLFWLNASDTALVAVAWTGAGLGFLLLLGVRPRLLLVLLWLLYLSLSVVGQDFLSFQWDALLLESGLLAILWAPRRFVRRVSEPPILLVSEPPGPLEASSGGPPFDLARFLLVFLLFKLMFLSGVTKILSGDPTWRYGTALDFHFETQPLPPWSAWYAHHWPTWIHHALTWWTLAVELGAPWFLLLPGRLQPARVPAVLAIAVLQVGIAATGNYGFFNLLTLALCLPALSGARRARDDLQMEGPDTDRTPHRWPLVRIAAPVLLGLSLLSMVREVAFTLPNGRGAGWWPAWGGKVLGWVEPFRSVNGYGLFRVMTTERPELVFEGSRDGVQWEPYGFRYKPGNVDRRPAFVAPFHPRLDWQLWFAALSPGRNLGWVERLAEALRAGTPEVVALLGHDPFPTTPPQYVRAVLYDYRFSTPEQRRRTGSWWVRTLQGTFVLGSSVADSSGS
jgi:lipase maturation factor 1